jgi:hypothetical protein
MGSIDEAQKMLDIFTSVGARSFFITKLNLFQEKIWAKGYTPPELQQKLPYIMRTPKLQPFRTNEGQPIFAGENVIVRPSGPNTIFVQLDDLQHAQLERLKPAAFLMLETSPEKYQAWISVERNGADNEAAKDIIRRVRRAVGDTDKAASGATRIAGSRNFKIKYAPEFPTVTTIHAAPGRVLTEEELSQMGLLAASEPVKIPPSFASTVTGTRPWPSYQICLQRAPKKVDGSPDRSKADFAFALTSLTGQHGVEETIARLTEVSERVRERLRSDPGYARVTVQNALKCVNQNYSKSRSRA